MTNWHLVLAGAFLGPGLPTHTRVHTTHGAFTGTLRGPPREDEDFVILLAGTAQTAIALDAVIAIELILAAEIDPAKLRPSSA